MIDVTYLYTEAGKRFAKIPWSRLHLRDEYLAHAGEASDLTIRAAILEKPKEIHTQKLSNDGAEHYYSGTALPSEEGPWRLIATSGPDWGCFDLKAS
ncbi:MAG: hypothetical protein ACRDTR_06165 [Rubrobacter sp.]